MNNEKKNNEKKNKFGPPLDPLCPRFWEVSSVASPVKIWEVMPPFLKTLFEQKAEN